MSKLESQKPISEEPKLPQDERVEYVGRLMQQYSGAVPAHPDPVQQALDRHHIGDRRSFPLGNDTWVWIQPPEKDLVHRSAMRLARYGASSVEDVYLEKFRYFDLRQATIEYHMTDSSNDIETEVHLEDTHSAVLKAEGFLEKFREALKQPPLQSK